jgi:hypothetical protein
MCDEAFESLLEELVRQHRDAFRAERFSLAELSREPQAPLPLPASLMPAATPESLSAESEPTSERRSLIRPLLTFLVVALAMILGVLLGMHTARLRFESRILKQSDSAGALPKVSKPLNVQSVPDDIGQQNLPVPTSVSRKSDSHDRDWRASTQTLTPGELTVFENGRIIFGCQLLRTKCRDSRTRNLISYERPGRQPGCRLA